MLIKRTTEGPPGTATDIAWVAGFWDGEGSFIADGRSLVVSLQISQAGPGAEGLLTRVATSLGLPASIYAGWRRPQHQPNCKLHIVGENAVRAFELCKPYLSETKRSQAQARISAWRERQQAFIHFKLRNTHCPQGHEFNLANTRYNQRGARVCRECRRAAGRRAYAAKRALLGRTVTATPSKRRPTGLTAG